MLILRDGLTLHNVHIYLSYFHTLVLFILHNRVTSHTSSFIYISNCTHPPTGSSNLSLIKCFLKVIFNNFSYIITNCTHPPPTGSSNLSLIKCFLKVIFSNFSYIIIIITNCTHPPPTGSSNLSLIKCFLKVLLPMQTERRLCYTLATNEGRAQVINLNYLPQPKTMHE